MSKLEDLQYLLFLEQLDSDKLPRDFARHFGFESSQPDLHFFPVIFDRGYYLIVYYENAYVLTEILGNVVGRDFGKKPTREWRGQDILSLHVLENDDLSFTNEVEIRKRVVLGYAGDDFIAYAFRFFTPRPVYVVVKWKFEGNRLRITSVHDYLAGELYDVDVQLVSVTKIVLKRIASMYRN